MASTTKANTWFTTTNVNGDAEVDNIWGKFYTWNSLSTECKNPTGGNFSNTIASTSNCPCPIGWHIPTEPEWATLEQTLNAGVACITDNVWQCS